MSLKALTSLILIGTVSQALALPDPRSNINELSSKISLTGLGPLMGDHDVKNLLYVSPSDLSVTGQFYQTAYGVDCKQLKQLRDLTYRTPLPGQVVDSKIYYSPSHYLQAVVPAETTDIEEQILALKKEMLKTKEENKKVMREYDSSYQDLEDKKAVYKEAQDNLTLNHDRLMKELVLANSEAERNQIRENNKIVVKDLFIKIDEAGALRSQAQARFNLAAKEWSPIKSELKNNEELEASLRTTLENYKKSATELLELSKTQLALLSDKIVGKATAGYSFRPNEKLDLLSQRLLDAKLDYTVRALDVFNVNFNPKSLTRFNEAGDVLPDPLLGPVKTEQNVSVSNGTQIVTIPAQLDVPGEAPRPLSFEMKSYSPGTGSAQAFEMPISQGVVCGDMTIETKKMAVKSSQGDVVVTEIQSPVFEETSKVVWSKNIPLTFNYYQKAEPISGKCTMNIDQTSVYVRENGKKKSGGFFKRKTSSWDNTRSELNRDFGINCTVTKSPIGSNPEESRLINDALEKSLYQDVYQLFLLSYASKWDVIPTDPAQLGEDSKFFSKFGSGLMNLCGPNKYCEFSGVVLKSLDELVGSRHTGSTSNRSSSKGTLTKDYNLNGYFIAEGSANVELKVCLERSKCK